MLPCRHYFAIINTIQNIDCKLIPLNSRWLFNDDDDDDDDYENKNENANDDDDNGGHFDKEAITEINYNYEEINYNNEDSQNNDKPKKLELKNPQLTVQRGRPHGRYKSCLEKVNSRSKNKAKAKLKSKKTKPQNEPVDLKPKAKKVKKN